MAQPASLPGVRLLTCYTSVVALFLPMGLQVSEDLQLGRVVVSEALLGSRWLGDVVQLYLPKELQES